MKNNSFSNKTVIVTGASSGIGRATALALAERGACVVLASRNVAELEQAASEIKSMGQEALVVPTDVTQREQVEHLVGETLRHWGRVDVLIANSGQYIRAPIAKMSLETLQQSMAVNFYSGVYSVLAVLPHMLAQKSGHIVLVSTLNGRKGVPPDAPYAAAKFALTGLGEVLRQELHGSGVHLTTVLPGRVDTPMIADLRVPRISAKIAPEKVARAILGALRRPRPEIITPSHTRTLIYLNTISPRLGDWVVRFFRLSGWEEK